MTSPTDVRHEHFRQLYFSERARRETIRGGIATPVAAISFAVFALGTLTAAFDAGRWLEPVSLAMIALAGASVLALLGAVYHVVMVEWLFVYHEPPRLDALLAAERQLDDGRDADAVARRFTEFMVASYAIAYEQYLSGNAMSARSRTWALRLILASLSCLALAFLLLPIHRAD